MTLNITATDFFCGAGGSSSGLVAAGIEVRSDSVISRAEDSGDWSDHDDDERMHKEFVAELKRRGEKL